MWLYEHRTVLIEHGVQRNNRLFKKGDNVNVQFLDVTSGFYVFSAPGKLKIDLNMVRL